MCKYHSKVFSEEGGMSVICLALQVYGIWVPAGGSRGFAYSSIQWDGTSLLCWCFWHVHNCHWNTSQVHYNSI